MIFFDMPGTENTVRIKTEFLISKDTNTFELVKAIKQTEGCCIANNYIATKPAKLHV